ncbi:hypothetical protein DL98DRAFT_534600 [Cadophora sp. DSE1049]|nr:hypothetical protein DL98DRAFT_534600 [Cadophora sp. DSE1049]
MCRMPHEYQRKNPKRKTASTQTTEIGSRPDASTTSKNRTATKGIPPDPPTTSKVLLTFSQENGSLYNIFETFPPHLDAADLAYLHSHDALTLPTESFQIALLSAYINFVHVKMPILDMRQFLSIVKRGNDRLDVDEGKNDDPKPSNGKKISFLLFQAVLFAGVEYVGSEVLDEEGFESRENAKETLFNRVRLLYDFDTCTQRLAVIQSLLLMSYCPRNATRALGFKDSTHWLDQAISFAYSLGLNRQLDEERSSHRKKSLDRRIWWSLFIQDQVVDLRLSSKQRRSLRIEKRDCKIGMVTLDDFELDDFGHGQKEAETFRLKENAMLFVEKAILCWSAHNSKISTIPMPITSRATVAMEENIVVATARHSSTRTSSPFGCPISTPSTMPDLSPSSLERSPSPKNRERLQSAPITDCRTGSGGPSIENAAREYSDYLEYIGEAMSGQSSSPMDMVREARFSEIS